MKILVTGAAGFIGFHLCRRLAPQGNEVVGIDSINDYYDPGLKYSRLVELGIDRTSAASKLIRRSSSLAGFSFARLSVCDRAGVRRLFDRQQFECVVHLAAQAGVRYSIENPHAYVETNVSGFLNVLEGCRANGVKHLVFASSSSVYGLSSRLPLSEHDPANHPASLYAATKKSNEVMAHAYSHLFHLPATGLRFFTVYGPWGRPDMAYYTFARAIMNDVPIDLYNGGDMSRDFTYIDDAVEAVVRAVGHVPSPNQSWDPFNADSGSSRAPFRIYNVGNGKAQALEIVIQAIERELGKTARRRTMPMQPGDVRATEASIEGIARDLDWRPTTPLSEGIARFVRWLREYER